VNILVVSRCLPFPVHHGDRLMLHYLARELAARGCQLDLLALSSPGEPAGVRENIPGFRFVRSFSERSRSPFDFPMRALHLFPDSARQCWNPEMWEAIRERMELGGIDLVHFFGSIQVYEFRNLVLQRLPAIIVPGDSMSLLYERKLAAARRPGDRLLSWIQLATARWYEKRIYAGFGGTVFVSAVDGACVSQLDPGLNPVVIPNGVDPDNSGALKIGTGPVLLFVGNYAYQPNLEAAEFLVDRILPLVKQQAPSARVVLVGANPPQSLRRRSSEAVEVTGYVQDVRPYLRLASCLVSPLQSGAGIHNKVLEAMASGLPVVASPLSCEGIRVTPGENVLLGETPEELARAILLLFDDEQRRAAIGNNGRRLMQEHYSWGEVARRYLALYADVIASFRSVP